MDRQYRGMAAAIKDRAQLGLANTASTGVG
jgi:hypothetical protein